MTKHLSPQKCVCHDKHVFVMTVFSLCQTHVCHDKTLSFFFLSQQHRLFVTKILLVAAPSSDKWEDWGGVRMGVGGCTGFDSSLIGGN